MVVSEAAPGSTPLGTATADGDDAAFIEDLSLIAGDRYPLLAIDAGEEDTAGISAEAYRVWCQIALPDGDTGWAQAAIPTDYDSGSDSRSSSMRFDLLPNVATPE